MITRVCAGRKFLACGPGCAESFQEDRKQGLIYGSIDVKGKLYGWEEGSVVGQFCAYCRQTAEGLLELRGKWPVK